MEQDAMTVRFFVPFSQISSLEAVKLEVSTVPFGIIACIFLSTTFI